MLVTVMVAGGWWLVDDGWWGCRGSGGRGGGREAVGWCGGARVWRWMVVGGWWLVDGRLTVPWGGVHHVMSDHWHRSHSQRLTGASTSAAAMVTPTRVLPTATAKPSSYDGAGAPESNEVLGF